MTLARFNSDVNQKFVKTVQELSKNIKIDPYIVDSVSLITANAVLSKLRIIETWKLELFNCMSLRGVLRIGGRRGNLII